MTTFKLLFLFHKHIYYNPRSDLLKIKYLYLRVNIIIQNINQRLLFSKLLLFVILKKLLVHI